MRHETYEFGGNSEFPPVLHSGVSMNAPRYAAIDSDYATTKEGIWRKNQKIFRPGYFAGSIANSQKVRLLPRTYVNTAVAANDTSVVVKDAGIFIANDALKVLAPSGRIAIGSSSTGWAENDTVTAVVNSISTTYTVVAGDIAGSATVTHANIANKLLAAVLANPYLSGKVEGLTTGGVIVFWSSDFAALYTLSASKSSTNGTATASGSAFVPNVAIGTVSAINTATNTLTISAASVALPVGMPIGVAESSPRGLGMLQPNQALDLLYDISQHYALWVEATVYRVRLPYWDGELARLFPLIVLV